MTIILLCLKSKIPFEIYNICSRAQFGLVQFDRGRQELWLCYHITTYRCPSSVKLRQTFARRDSELALLKEYPFTCDCSSHRTHRPVNYWWFLNKVF